MRYSLNDSLPDSRYHPSRWSQTAKLTKKLTKGRCCLCLSKAAEVHHAYYGVRLLKWHFPVAGLEIPLWQVFPLCLNCHSNRIGMAHHIKSKKGGNYVVTDSSWTNHNTTAYTWKLRRHAWLCLLFVRWWFWAGILSFAIFINVK